MLAPPGTCPSPVGRCNPGVPDILITFITPNGEEREERWPTIAAFRAWAVTRDQRLNYTAFAEDEDGEWVVIEKGHVAGSTHGSAQ